jgi:hypothetical protein
MSCLYPTVYNRMTEWLVSDELQAIWKESAPGPVKVQPKIYLEEITKCIKIWVSPCGFVVGEAALQKTLLRIIRFAPVSTSWHLLHYHSSVTGTALS